ncbi:MAG: hypothetical protein WBK77_07230, partial [Alphaproteobacteria bacterium]
MSGASNTTPIWQQFLAAGAMLVASVAPSVAGDLNSELITEKEYAEHIKRVMAEKPLRDVAAKKFAEMVQRGSPASGETCLIVYENINSGEQKLAMPQFFNKEAAIQGAKSLPAIHPREKPTV